MPTNPAQSRTSTAMAVIAANAVAADVPVAGAQAVAVVDAQAVAADGVAIVDDAADDNSGVC
jgi:hypothetical protein